MSIAATHYITMTTNNKKLNEPCSPRQAFIIGYLDYLNEKSEYNWNKPFEKLDMRDIVTVASACKTDHPSPAIMSDAADRILGT